MTELNEEIQQLTEQLKSKDNEPLEGQEKKSIEEEPIAVEEGKQDYQKLSGQKKEILNELELAIDQKKMEL